MSDIDVDHTEEKPSVSDGFLLQQFDAKRWLKPERITQYVRGAGVMVNRVPEEAVVRINRSVDGVVRIGLRQRFRYEEVQVHSDRSVVTQTRPNKSREVAFRILPLQLDELGSVWDDLYQEAEQSFNDWVVSGCDIQGGFSLPNKNWDMHTISRGRVLFVPLLDNANFHRQVTSVLEQIDKRRRVKVVTQGLGSATLYERHTLVKEER